MELVIPKLFESLCGSLTLYGGYWHLPQKMVLAPDGDLLLSNIYRGTLWRMRTDGSLPEEGWTSVYHRGRNEPFESHDWSQDFLNVQDLQNYLPFQSLHYPYFCFDPKGDLYISSGVSSRWTRQYGYHWEVSQQEVTYQQDVSRDEGRGTLVWKCRMQTGVRMDIQDAFGGFADPGGVVHDGTHLIVADSGKNRLQVLGPDGTVAATITHYDQAGQRLPLYGPTALAMDHDQHLYVLIGSKPRTTSREIVERTLATIQQDYLIAAQTSSDDFTQLIKLKSWREPQSVGRFRSPASGCAADRRRCRRITTSGVGGKRRRSRESAAIGGRRSGDEGTVGREWRGTDLSAAKRQPADPQYRPADRRPLRRR